MINAKSLDKFIMAPVECGSSLLINKKDMEIRKDPTTRISRSMESCFDFILKSVRCHLKLKGRRGFHGE